VGVRLAQRIGAEVVALDSMTLYRGMDIGTAKPTTAERDGVPHHLIDVLDPWESASVAVYRELAAAAVREIEARGRRALFVGGTPLYLKTLLRGLFEGPGSDSEIRARLEAEAEAAGPDALHERLARVDPTTASRLHPNDLRRIVRALEVFELSGSPLSTFQSQHAAAAPAEVAVFALWRPRPELHDRIDRRVVAMFEAGLIDEVRALISAERPLSSVASQGVGYLEVIEYLRGGPSMAQTIERVQARTRQFAKRQETWFRGLSEVQSLAVGDAAAAAIAAQIADRLETH
jgi:tRNA dimethylallyltransferase